MQKDEKYIEIIEAIHKLKLENEVLEIMNIEKDELLNKIKDEFVVGNPRVWWLSFKKKSKNYIFNDEFQYKRINQFFKENEICYFISEFDDLFLFKTSVKNIIELINECSFFEYYIVNLELSNLLCETDHGDLLFIT
jgi:hypothetical protein